MFGSRIEGEQVGVVEEQFVELYQEEIFEEGKCNIGFLVPMNIIQIIHMHVSKLKYL